jgi:transcriptional regulator with GAF, ATPase, and Fis domain
MLLSALRQEDMLRHKARADSLLETAAAVHTDEPVHAKAARVMKAVQLGCECERCSIVLLDEVQEHLFLVSTDRDAAGITIPCGQGIAGAVVASGEVENVADAYADDRFDKTTDEKTGFVTRNILAVPLRNEGRVVGVLMALNQAITFDSEHQETLEAIADQISASMLADLLNHMFTGSAEDHSRNDEELTRARLALLSEYAQFQTIKRESSKGGRTIMLASEILTGREKLTRSSSGKWLTTASKVSLNSLSLSTFSSSLPAGLTADPTASTLRSSSRSRPCSSSARAC